MESGGNSTNPGLASVYCFCNKEQEHYFTSRCIKPLSGRRHGLHHIDTCLTTQARAPERHPQPCPSSSVARTRNPPLSPLPFPSLPLPRSTRSKLTSPLCLPPRPGVPAPPPSSTPWPPTPPWAPTRSRSKTTTVRLKFPSLPPTPTPTLCRLHPPNTTIAPAQRPSSTPSPPAATPPRGATPSAPLTTTVLLTAKLVMASSPNHHVARPPSPAAHTVLVCCRHASCPPCPLAREHPFLPGLFPRLPSQAPSLANRQ